MKSTKHPNPYEHLKLDRLCNFDPVAPQSTWVITEHPDERVAILTSALEQGEWCYGYQVCWKNGRISYLEPDPQKGLFASQREAQLYALGFMSLYASYFTEATNTAILKSISIKSQTSLF